jgi:hypothetical protein
MSTPLSRMRPAGGTALGTAARRLFEGVDLPIDAGSVDWP